MLNVCGLLVHTRPDHARQVEASLQEIPGVETHGEGEQSRLVVTVEDTETMSAMDAIAKVNAVDGVVASALVYHEMEPDEEQATPLSEGNDCSISLKESIAS